MPPISEIALVAAGGALGAVSRFLIQQCAPTAYDKYVHTLGVNLTGCIAIGIVWALMSHFGAPQWVNRLLVAGFLGGYTTFSAFALDSMQLLEAGRIAAAMSYAAVSVAGGILLCALAAMLVRGLLS